MRPFVFALRPGLSLWRKSVLRGWLERRDGRMRLTKEKIVALLADEAGEEALFRQADEVRKEFVGDAVHLRGLIEFSNICRNDCLYCGIRRSNKKVCRYRLEPEALIETARRAAAAGFKTLVMQSGEDLYYTPERLCPVIEKIKKFDVAVTLSLGERSYADYKAFREAGADRYLMRIETTDKDLYHRLDPGMSWQRRYECLLELKELGYELGSGIMTGLPGQCLASIAEDLLFLQKLGIDMAGIGPFIPHAETPLAREAGGTLGLALRTMAVMRLLLPDINIPATTAMETLHPGGRLKALQAGANVVMLNVTEKCYSRLYALYPGKTRGAAAETGRDELGEQLETLGRRIGAGYGSRKQNPVC